MRKVVFENGLEIALEPGETPEQAITRYEAYKATGYNPNFEAESKARTEKAVTDARTQWAEDSPVAGRVASYQAAAKNLGRNLLQMALPQSLEKFAGVTDQDIKRRQAEEQPLKDAYGGAYMTGEIVPTLVTAGAGLIPMLAKAMAAYPAIAASVQGALFGAASAGPDDRKTGALIGGITAPLGGVLNKALRGAAPNSQLADDWYAAWEKANPGKPRPFLPLTMTANKVGPGSGVQRAMNWVQQQPGAVGAAREQFANAEKSAMDAIVRVPYGQYADDIMANSTKGQGTATNILDSLQVGDDLYKAAHETNVIQPARDALKAAQGAVKLVNTTAKQAATDAAQKVAAKEAAALSAANAAKAAEQRVAAEKAAAIAKANAPVQAKWGAAAQASPADQAAALAASKSVKAAEKAAQAAVSKSGKAAAAVASAQNAAKVAASKSAVELSKAQGVSRQARGALTAALANDTGVPASKAVAVDVIKAAAERARSGTPTMQAIGAKARDLGMGDEGADLMRTLAWGYDDLQKGAVVPMTYGQRVLTGKLQPSVWGAAKDAAKTLSVVWPAASRIVMTEGFQKALGGNTAIQQMVQRGVAKNQLDKAVIEFTKNYLATQGGGAVQGASAAVGEFVSDPVENTKKLTAEQMEEAAKYLRGNE